MLLLSTDDLRYNSSVLGYMVLQVTYGLALKQESHMVPCTFRLLDLPASTTFADLMGAGAAVKSAMKSSGIVAVDAMNHSSAGGMGQSRQIITHHPGDGHPLHLEVQV